MKNRQDLTIEEVAATFVSSEKRKALFLAKQIKKSMLAKEGFSWAFLLVAAVPALMKLVEMVKDLLGSEDKETDLGIQLKLSTDLATKLTAESDSSKIAIPSVPKPTTLIPTTATPLVMSPTLELESSSLKSMGWSAATVGTGEAITGKLIPDIPIDYTGPLPSKDISTILDQVCIAYGIDRGLMYAIASVESSFNPGAQAKTSSAKGLFQFTQDTWNYLTKKKFPELKYRSRDIQDPRKNAILAAVHFKSIWTSLKTSQNKLPSVADIYLAHFLGLAGASKFLTQLVQKPEQSAVKSFPSQAAANRRIFYDSGKEKSLAQVWQSLGGKVNQAYQKFAAIKPTTGTTETAPAVEKVGSPSLVQKVSISEGSQAVKASPIADTPVAFQPIATGEKLGVKQQKRQSTQPNQEVAIIEQPSTPTLAATSYLNGKNGRRYSLQTM
jgi:hypothetical protein